MPTIMVGMMGKFEFKLLIHRIFVALKTDQLNESH